MTRAIVLSAALVSILMVAQPLLAQREPRRTNQVRITIADGYRHITCNGLPDHLTGRFPNPGNPNSIRAQEYQFKVPLEPREAPGQPRRAGGAILFGVALNGVVFDPGTAEFWNDDRRAGWNYEAIGGAIDLGLDANHAHVQPTGAYHYHGVPSGLLKKLAGANATQQMTLIAWAADGYPVYAIYGYANANDPRSGVKKLSPSYRLRDGRRPDPPQGPGGRFDGTFTADFEFVEGLGELDEFNGREGVTPEFPDGTYYYVLTEDFPHVPRMFRGIPDESFERMPGHAPPPRGRGGDRHRPHRDQRQRR